MTGSQNNGWSWTNNIKGRPNAAPPKPRPLRTKPAQMKNRAVMPICNRVKSNNINRNDTKSIIANILIPYS